LTLEFVKRVYNHLSVQRLHTMDFRLLQDI